MISIVVAAESENSANLLIQRLNKENKYKTTYAKNGLEALEIINSSYPDMIITGIGMPVMNGITLITRVREIENYNPIIYVITGFSNDNTIRILSQFNINLLSVKPVDVETVIRSVDRLVLIFGVQDNNNAIDANMDNKNEIKNSYTLEDAIEEALTDLGLKSYLISFKLTKEAIRLVYSFPDATVTNDIYPSVAKAFNTTESAVENAIRYSIKKGREGVRGDLFIHEKIGNLFFLQGICDHIRMNYKIVEKM